MLVAQAMKTASADFIFVCKKAGGPLFLFFFSAAVLTLTCDFLLNDLPPSSTSALLEVITYLLTALIQLFPLLFIPVVIHFKEEEKTLGESFRHVFLRIPLICIESIRAIASVLRWSLLFLLPGLFKQLRYYFVPYVVLFHPGYDRGEVDALKSSNSTLKGATFWFLFIFLGDLLVLALLEPTNHWQKATHQPLIYLLQFVFQAGYKVFFYSFLYHYFMALKEEKCP